MISSPPQRHLKRHPNAFTMLELLLVMAIMIAALAIGWPMLQRSFQTQRLKKGGERIQAEWAKARNLAIRTGRVQVFQHAVYSNRFVTTSQPSDEDLWQSETVSTPENLDLDSPNSQLPEGVFFIGADVKLDQRTSFEMTNLVPLTATPDFEAAATMQQATGQIEWGTPIFFYPDGTTSTATLVLADDRQRSLSVTLRGLTGTSRCGPVETESDFSGGL